MDMKYESRRRKILVKCGRHNETKMGRKADKERRENNPANLLFFERNFIGVTFLFECVRKTKKIYKMI